MGIIYLVSEEEALILAFMSVINRNVDPLQYH